MKDRPEMGRIRMRLTWAFALLAGAVGSGCGSEENVSVGSVNRVLDLGMCTGANTVCTPGPANMDGPANVDDSAASLVPKLCSAEVTNTLAVEFQIDLDKLICSGATRCQYWVEDFKVADDESVWLLAQMHVVHPDQIPHPTLWLGHVTPDGKLLGKRVFTPSVDVLVERRLALLGDQAVLLAHGQEIRTWTQHYDAAVNPTGSQLGFDSVIATELATTSEGGLVISGVDWWNGQGTRRNVVAMLDRNGDLVWNQNNVVWYQADVAAGTYGAQAIAVDGLQRTVLLSSRVGEALTDTNTKEPGLHLIALDANGNRAWTHAFDFGGDESVHSLEFDDHDNLTIALVKAGGVAWVQSFLPNGEARWQWLLDSNLNLGMTVMPQDGRVFVVTLDGDTALDGTGSITELSSDGETCSKHAYTGVLNINKLSATRSGQIYFVGARSVGRFEPI